MAADSGIRKPVGIRIFFLLPAIVLYGGLFLLPAIDSLRLSLYKYDGLDFANAQFVGLQNFLDAFGDHWVAVALRNNLLIMTIGGAFMISLSLLFAVALTTGRIRGKDFFRTVIFFPYMLSGVGVGLFWTFVLNPSFGALNGILRAVGLGTLARPWLGEPTLALGSVIYVVVWWGIGFYMLFLAAGIESIPADIFDAGRVDGASESQMFFRITLPLLREFLAVAIVLWMIEALKTFAVVLLLTGGGPANQTQVLSTYLARMAFNIGGGSGGVIFRFGYGMTIAVILTILVALASTLYFRLRSREPIEF